MKWGNGPHKKQDFGDSCVSLALQRPQQIGSVVPFRDAEKVRVVQIQQHAADPALVMAQVGNE